MWLNGPCGPEHVEGSLTVRLTVAGIELEVCELPPQLRRKVPARTKTTLTAQKIALLDMAEPPWIGSEKKCNKYSELHQPLGALLMPLVQGDPYRIVAKRVDQSEAGRKGRPEYLKTSTIFYS